MKNKNIIFYIKPKNWEDWWILEIEKIIKEVTGKNSKNIKNLIITKKPSIYLIKNSINVIGFNSTVLLEALLLGCKPIIPNFNEAKGNQKKNVYFKDFKKIFHIANSEFDLAKKINISIKKIKDSSFNYFFGPYKIFEHYFDSNPKKIKEKTLNIINKIIFNYNKNQRKI